MYKLSLPMCLLLLVPLVVSANTADELVSAADKYRQSADNIKVSTVIKLFKNDLLDRERAYDVYIRPEQKSLVISKSPSEKGQKILMLQDNFWLLLPKTKRPIRITPMQKLIGDASTGDVATMRWAEDYSAKFIQTQKSSESGHNELKLIAKRKGVTYHQINLSLEPETHIPLRAEFYLKSGKLAKIAEFVVSDQEGQTLVTKMILRDKIHKNKHTIIEYLKNESYLLADKYYNPAYLARNPSVLSSMSVR